jgi:hypothetical protein
LTREVPLEEAPFSEYLKILRREGYEKDAQEAEDLYVTLLKEFEYTEEQIYKTPFKNLVEAAEKIIVEANKQMMSVLAPPSISGTVLRGAGADKLSPEQLNYVLRRQMQLHEEEKTRLGM